MRLRLEQYETSNGSDLRFVIENRGPASASDIDFTIRDLSGPGSMIGNVDILPVAELYAANEVHLPAHLAYGDPYPIRASLTWRDERGVQQREFVLTAQHVS